MTKEEDAMKKLKIWCNRPQFGYGGTEKGRLQAIADLTLHSDMMVVSGLKSVMDSIQNGEIINESHWERIEAGIESINRHNDGKKLSKTGMAWVKELELEE